MSPNKGGGDRGCCRCFYDGGCFCFLIMFDGVNRDMRGVAEASAYEAFSLVPSDQSAFN